VRTPQHPGDGKAALREAVLARRRARPPAERATAAAAVATALLHGLAGARTLAAFVPDAIEPGHGRLPAVYTQLGARVLLPVVPKDGSELAWAVDTGRLAPGRFGLLEPVGTRLGVEAVATADAVLLPGLAVSDRGDRLGKGGGCYDRALGRVPVGTFTCVLLYDEEVGVDVPVEPHDRPVTAAVTPAGITRFAPTF